MKQIHGQHLVFVVIAEDVGVIAFGGSDALLLLQLLDGGDQVAIAGGALELLGIGGFGHAFTSDFTRSVWRPSRKSFTSRTASL